MDYAGPSIEPSWIEQIGIIAPPHENNSWLKIVWVAGDWWEPVHRWGIYQMTPYHSAPDFLRGDLLGPNPRERGYYDTVLGHFMPDPACNVDRIQWELYRETRCYSKLIYCVQGRKGGHKRRFTKVESQEAMMLGASSQPPAIGDLPFAQPDQRTWARLAELDTFRSYNMMLDVLARSPEVLEREEQEIATRMRDAVRKHIGAQIEEVLEPHERELAEMHSVLHST